MSCIACRVMLLGWIAINRKRKRIFWLILVSQTPGGVSRSTQINIFEVAHSSRLPWCRDWEVRISPYLPLWMNEWIQNSLVKQSTSASLVIHSQMTLGIKSLKKKCKKWCTSKQKQTKKKDKKKKKLNACTAMLTKSWKHFVIHLCRG